MQKTLNVSIVKEGNTNFSNKYFLEKAIAFGNNFITAFVNDHMPLDGDI